MSQELARMAKALSDIHMMGVREAGSLLTNTRAIYLVNMPRPTLDPFKEPEVDPTWVVWSWECLNLMLAGVLWHDDPTHCPTFTTDCRCDVEPPR